MKGQPGLESGPRGKNPVQPPSVQGGARSFPTVSVWPVTAACPPHRDTEHSAPGSGGQRATQLCVCHARGGPALPSNTVRLETAPGATDEGSVPQDCHLSYTSAEYSPESEAVPCAFDQPAVDQRYR